MSNSSSNSVSVIDTATNTVVATVTVGGRFSVPFGVAVTPDGKHAYVTYGDNTVSVIDTASNTVVATVVVGNVPQGIAITPDGKHAYVANIADNTVSVIDTATNTVVGRSRSMWGLVPLGLPSPRMENTPMSRILAPTTSR